MIVAAKRILTVLVILLLLPVVLLVVGLAFLSSPIGENFIRLEAIERVEALTGLDVEIGDVSLSIFSSLTLQDVHVRHREIAPDVDLLAFDRLHVEYDLTPLLSKTIRINSFELDSLASHLVMTEAGTLNIPMDTAEDLADSSAQDSSTEDSPAQDNLSEGKEFPYRISIGEARIHLAEASYQDQGSQLNAELDSLVLHARGRLGGRYDYQLIWDQLRLDSDGRQLLVTDFLLGGHFFDETLTVDTLHALTPGAELDGDAVSELFPGADSTQQVEAGIRLTADLGRLSHHVRDLLPPMLDPVEGELLISATVTGSAMEPQAQIELSSGLLRAGAIELDSLLLRARGSMEKVELDRLYVEAFGGVAEAGGTITLDSLLNHQFELTLVDIDIVTVQSSFAPSDSAAASQVVEGSFGGYIHSSGALNQPWSLNAAADLKASLVSPGSDSREGINISLGYFDHDGSIRIRHGSSLIEANARLDENSIDGFFNLSIPQLADIAGPVGLENVTGAIRGEGTFTGNLEAPRVNATISGGGIRYQNFPLDSLLAVVEYDSGLVRIAQSHIGGIINEIDSTNAPFGLADISGGFSYEGAVTGVIPDLNGHIDLNTWELGYGDIATDYIDARMQLNGNRIDLPMLEITRDSRKLTIHGNYNLEGAAGEASLWFTGPNGSVDDDDSGDGRLNFGFVLLDSQRVSVMGYGRRINLADMPHVHPALADISGVLGAEVEFTGSALDPRGTVRLTLDSLRAADFVVDSLQIEVELDSTSLHSDLAAIFQSTEPVTASVTLPLERTETGLAIAMDKRIKGFVVGDDIRLSIFKNLMPEGINADGLFTISYHVSGTLSEPSLLGEISLDSGWVDLGENQPRLEFIKANITQFGSMVEIERLNCSVLGHEIGLTGNATLLNSNAVDTEFDVNIDSSHALQGSAHFGANGYSATVSLPGIPLEPIKDFVPDIADIHGVITGTIFVEGDTSTPMIQGELQGSGINVVSKLIGENLHHGEFAVQFNNDSVEIDTLTAQFGEQGLLIVDGRADLAEQKPFFDLRVRGTNLSLEQDDYQVNLNGVTLDFVTNDQNRHILSGDIHLGETRYVRDYRLDTILRQMNDPPTRRIAKPNAIAENIELDLRLREADQLWVDNNLAKVRMDANISVIGTLGAPMITGRVSLDQGHVMYLDRKFDIEEGVVDFVDTRDINPYLNIVAFSTVIDYEQGEQYNYDITLIISGNMKSARIEMTSDPYLEQSNIISLLTFGSPHSGGGVGSQAGSLAGRAVSSYVGSTLGNAIGLESVSVQGNLFAPEESGATLMATKEISNRAEITYITNVSGFNENAIRISYFLTKNWTITGETNQEGEGSIDLKLKVRWNEIRWQ